MFVLQNEFDFSIIKEMWFNFGEGLQNSLKIEGINKEINLYFIISTHNEQFYNLLKVKMDERYYSSKFIVLSSAGIIEQ